MQTSYQRLTDAQWEYIKEFLNWQRKRKLDLRAVFDAILYITRTGMQWRNLKETNFPKWESVYYYFSKWKKAGTLAKINLALNKLERLQKERKPKPSLGLVDSQSVKAAPMVGDRGLDGNKLVNGRKRHIFTDVIGRIYAAYVHPANRHDSPQGVHLLNKADQCLDSIKKILADKTYRGTFAKAVEELGIEFEVPIRPKGTKGFVIEAKRWVVERTFAWLNSYRRLIVDHEKTVQSSVSFLFLANISMTLSAIDFNAKLNF